MPIQIREDDGARGKPQTRMETTLEAVTRLSAPKRDSRGRFKPGTSGNPAGKRKMERKPQMKGLLGAIMCEFDRDVMVIGKNRKRKPVKRIQVYAARLVDDLIGENSVARARATRILIALGFPEVLEGVQHWREDWDYEQDRAFESAERHLNELINKYPLDLFGFSEDDRGEIVVD